uniref:Nucleoside phosphorylase domain-containing protein n=1 Tax=Bionectria ochroleuca TaxID=29856 RepID=A0A0B7KRS4_BIOOC
MRTTIARHRLPPRRPSRSTSHLRYPFADIETSVDATDATPTYAIDHFSRRRPTEIRMRCRKDSLEHEAYRIGWICSLEVEHTAAGETLDEERDRLTQNPADHNVYKLGSINNHNVVIILLPTTGNKTAATVIAQMRMAFPSLQYGLLVGIGGGVPIRTENGSLRLGHVVVGTPWVDLTAACRSFSMLHELWLPSAKDLIQIRSAKATPSRSKQLGKSCAEGGCDPGQRIDRRIGEDEESFVVVHRDTIASGVLVVNTAVLRDCLGGLYGVLCFETKAAGAPSQNDQWQGYAAAVAAAYAGQLLFHLPTEASYNLDMADSISELTSH